MSEVMEKDFWITITYDVLAKEFMFRAGTEGESYVQLRIVSMESATRLMDKIMGIVVKNVKNLFEYRRRDFTITIDFPYQT